jgi:hypothetical protein
MNNKIIIIIMVILHHGLSSCKDAQQSLLRVYNHALYLYDRGNFDTASLIFKKIYPTGFNERTIASKLRLHALRRQDWDEAASYDLAPYWWYDADIAHKTILITYDGGFGDAIQFIRYAKHLHTAGATVVAQVPEALMPLCSTCPFITQCIPKPETINADYTVRISMPHLTLTMQSTLTQPSVDIPYLFADPSLISHWADRLVSDTSSLRVGLCWSCSYTYSKYQKKRVPGPRSIPLNTFAPLFETENATFYSLQKGPSEHDSTTERFPLKSSDDLDTLNGAFMDSAALMKNLDLVITVDTSIAHLAGALGAPVWLLVPINSDFRWFLDRTDSPWYPTMRLFRQKKIGDWNTVMTEIAHELIHYRGKK